MMSNLFSIFDTSTNTPYEMNWMSTLLNIMLIPMYYWLFSSKMNYLYKFIMNKLFNEFKIIMNNKFNMILSIYMISLMIMILINNIMGLLPYIFTSSSHLIFSISISLPMWLSFMLFGWTKNSNFMFSHLIPQSTPYILMPFMVMIETISNIIRPSTLSIRLTANMIAGHLLMTLLSQSTVNPYYTLIMILIIMMQITLMTLEFSVSIIQSYVFTILSTLYLKETN